MATEQTVPVRVFRKGPDDAEGRHETFHVPYGDGWSVMNVLRYIRDELDSTFAYYESCKLGLCTSCWVVVNGKQVLSCTTPVKKDMTIDPPAKFRLLRDLLIEPIER